MSELVSKETIHFVGERGYLNYVGTLNSIALSYMNYKYTSDARYLASGTQSEYCSSLNDCTGDIDDSSDIELVRSAVGHLSAFNWGYTAAPSYLLGQRVYTEPLRYEFIESSVPGQSGVWKDTCKNVFITGVPSDKKATYKAYSGSYVKNTHVIGGEDKNTYGWSRLYNSCKLEEEISGSLRPVLIFKSNVRVAQKGIEWSVVD